MVASPLRKGMGGKRVKMMLPSLIWIDFYVSFFDDPCHAFFNVAILYWSFFVLLFVIVCHCVCQFVQIVVLRKLKKIDDEKKIS